MTASILVTESLRLWDYTVSHNVALFRRPASAAEPENLDLVFAAVEYLAVPTTLHGLEIAEGNAAELAALGPLAGNLAQHAKLFIITSQGQRFLIVAGSWQLERNQRNMFEAGIRPSDPAASFTVLASSSS